MSNPDGFTSLVQAELERARQKHRGPVSPHEGYAILLEELDEFWDEVKKQEPDMVRMLEELVQIGAMAQRVAEEVIEPWFQGKLRVK